MSTTVPKQQSTRDRSVLRSREVASISSSNASSSSNQQLNTQTSYSTIEDYFKQRGYVFGKVIGIGSYAKVK